MSNIPVYCNECNLIFNSGISFGGGVNIEIMNIASKCPKCKKSITIPSGVYSEISGVLKFISSQDSEFFISLKNIFQSNLSDDIKLSMVDKMFEKKSSQSLSESLRKTSREYSFDAKNILIFLYKLIKEIGSVSGGIVGLNYLKDWFM